MDWYRLQAVAKSLMRAYVLIGLGGVAGANARYLVAAWAARRWGTAFPYGTFIINAGGCFVLAFALTYAAARLHNSADVRLLGFQGGLVALDGQGDQAGTGLKQKPLFRVQKS